MKMACLQAFNLQELTRKNEVDNYLTRLNNTNICYLNQDSPFIAREGT